MRGGPYRDSNYQPEGSDGGFLLKENPNPKMAKTLVAVAAFSFGLPITITGAFVTYAFNAPEERVDALKNYFGKIVGRY